MKKYSIIYADPPWYYYGDPNKNAAAGKHYPLMKTEDIMELPVKNIAAKRSVCLLWATSPKLNDAIKVLEAWGFYYRGVHQVWVKVRKSDGKIINGQGIRPSFIKPLAEFLLIGATTPKGRTLPIKSESLPHVVLAPRGRHSEKPEIFRKYIVDLFGDDLPKIELFARKKVDGWDVWGNEVESDIDLVGSKNKNEAE